MIRRALAAEISAGEVDLLALGTARLIGRGDEFTRGLLPGADFLRRGLLRLGGERGGLTPLPPADGPLDLTQALAVLVALRVARALGPAGNTGDECYESVRTIGHDYSPCDIPSVARLKVVDMPRKVPDVDLDDLFRRYLAGESPSKIAPTIGVSTAWVYKRLKEAGITRTPTEAKRLAADRKVAANEGWIADAVRLHLEGATQDQIAEVVGRAQSTVSSVLLRRGYRIERSAASTRRWASMTAEQRAAQVGAAHEAVRGMTRALGDLERRALGKERTRAHATIEELELAACLERLGIECVPQKAIGKYNIDIGAEPVAVELFGGNWHADGRHRARLPQRVEDLADAGWNLYIAWCALGRSLDIPAVAQDVIAFLELSRRDPAFRRQYRVVWGDGELVASGCVDDDDRTLIPARISRSDTAGR